MNFCPNCGHQFKACPPLPVISTAQEATPLEKAALASLKSKLLEIAPRYYLQDQLIRTGAALPR